MKKFTRLGTTNSSGGLFSFRNTTTLFKSSGTFKRPSLFMIIVNARCFGGLRHGRCRFQCRMTSKLSRIARSKALPRNPVPPVRSMLFMVADPSIRYNIMPYFNMSVFT